MEGGYHRPAPGSSSSTGMNSLPADINANNDNNVSNTNNNSVERTVREHERYVPIPNVVRVMRKVLTPHAKISDGAKELIQECVSEYISFITGEANDRAKREQRKTIIAEDILWAMRKLGFDDYIDPLALYLNRYRDFVGYRGSMTSTPLVNRVVGHHDAGTMVPPFNAPMYGPMPMGGFFYGGGYEVYPPMVGYVNEAHNPGSSSQAGVENSGQYGHGPYGPQDHGNNL